LNRGISNDNVATKYVALSARDDDDPVGVPEYLVILYLVVVISRADKTDAEVAALGCVSVSA
jgi:hypothetical protein